MDRVMVVGSPRVLLVDDEAQVRRAFARLLQAAGYEVACASNGAEALRCLEQAPVDVVLSDVSMPGYNGIELLRAVRARDTDVPVLLMTGNPAVETAVDALEYGATRYLLKPVDPAELRTQVSRAVQLRQLARAKREAMALASQDAGVPGDLAGLEATFARALDRLWVAFQPILRGIDGAEIAYEALVRSDEPSMACPGHLLDAAERLGRTLDLGRRVRRMAATAMRDAPDRLLFVNIAPEELHDEQLVDSFAPLARMASRVVLEVTERAPLDGVHDLSSRVADLRGAGYHIAIDDLGAGYAGLSSFAQLEPDYVKIDMSLVRGIEESVTRRKVVGSLVSLCRDMNMTVVAEGIETVPERDTLRGLGCAMLQGFRFAHPGPPFPTSAW